MKNLKEYIEAGIDLVDDGLGYAPEDYLPGQIDQKIVERFEKTLKEVSEKIFQEGWQCNSLAEELALRAICWEAENAICAEIEIAANGSLEVNELDPDEIVMFRESRCEDFDVDLLFDRRFDGIVNLHQKDWWKPFRARGNDA